jgi:chromosome segregation ATPase
MYVSLGEIRADFDSAISLMEMEEEKRYTRELKERISHLEAALDVEFSSSKENKECAQRKQEEYEYQVANWTRRIEDLEGKLCRRDKEIADQKNYINLKMTEFDGVRKEYNENKRLMEKDKCSIEARSVRVHEAFVKEQGAVITLNKKCEDLNKQNRELNKKNGELVETLNSIRTLILKPAKKTSSPFSGRSLEFDSSNLEEYIHEGVTYKLDKETNILHDIDDNSRMGEMKYDKDNKPYPEFDEDGESDSE